MGYGCCCYRSTWPSSGLILLQLPFILNGPIDLYHATNDTPPLGGFNSMWYTGQMGARMGRQHGMPTINAYENMGLGDMNKWMDTAAFNVHDCCCCCFVNRNTTNQRVQYNGLYLLYSTRRPLSFIVSLVMLTRSSLFHFSVLRPVYYTTPTRYPRPG